ncbi:MAG TPA: threonine/serine exporter family protein [Methanomassiliicoccales archaeon]|jgi:uncharacterized membrane protein YjjP (DUF1212 family)
MQQTIEISGECAAPPDETADLLLYLGRTLYLYGASAQRIIDSMQVLNRHLGGRDVHILVNPDAIMVTTVSGAEYRTKIDTVPSTGTIDNGIVSGISSMLHSLTTEMDHVRIRAELDRLNQEHGSRGTLSMMAITAVAMAAFGLLNGGDLSSVLVVLPATALSFMVFRMMGRQGWNYYVNVLAATLVGAISACMLARLGITNATDVSLIVSVIFLIPGVQLINGGIEIVRNHNLVGLSRLTMVIVTLAIIAFGITAAIALFPIPSQGALVPVVSWPDNIAYDALLGAIATCGFGALFYTPGYPLLACGVCGAVGRASRLILVNGGVDIALATLASVSLITVLALLFARRFRVPEIIMAVAAALTMIPGYFGVKFIEGVFTMEQHGSAATISELLGTVQVGLQTLFIAAAMVAGVIFPLMILRSRNPRY